MDRKDRVKPPMPWIRAGITTAMVVVLGGCGVSHDEAASPAGTTAAAGTGGSSHALVSKDSRATASPSMPSSTATRPANPVAGKRTPVIRNGKQPHPTISAASEPFSKTVRYSDGLSLHIDKIQQGVEAGYGPGVFHNSPTTQLSVTLTNGTKKALSLEQVVVQMVYGSPALLAPPVYDDAATDFSGLLKPGHSQTATYVFSVPTSHLSAVTMTVDMDGTHVAAVFSGSVKS